MIGRNFARAIAAGRAAHAGARNVEEIEAELELERWQRVQADRRAMVLRADLAAARIQRNAVLEELHDRDATARVDTANARAVLEGLRRRVQRIGELVVDDLTVGFPPRRQGPVSPSRALALVDDWAAEQLYQLDRITTPDPDEPDRHGGLGRLGTALWTTSNHPTGQFVAAEPAPARGQRSGGARRRPAPPATAAPSDDTEDVADPCLEDHRGRCSAPGHEHAPPEDDPGDSDEPFAFDEDDISGRPDPAAARVFQALGAASMCWSPQPHGVFQSRRAGAIGDALLAAFRPERAPAASPTTESDPSIPMPRCNHRGPRVAGAGVPLCCLPADGHEVHEPDPSWLDDIVAWASTGLIMGVAHHAPNAEPDPR